MPDRWFPQEPPEDVRNRLATYEREREERMWHYTRAWRSAWERPKPRGENVVTFKAQSQAQQKG